MAIEFMGMPGTPSSSSTATSSSTPGQESSATPCWWWTAPAWTAWAARAAWWLVDLHLLHLVLKDATSRLPDYGIAWKLFP